jgi:hypothetical protein
MSDGIKQGLTKHVVEVIEANPQVQMTIATGTTWMGIDLAFFQYVQTFFAFIVAVLGGILTVILIVRNFRGMIRENREYKYKLKNRDEQL